jgi:hypothetical protein
MAYGTKYRLSFTNVEDRACQLDIQEYSYTGSITTVLGYGDEPVIIKRYGEDKDLIVEPIRGSECVIKLVSQTNSQFAELFASVIRPFKVEYSEDSTILWTGFLHPEEYTEPYNIAPYETVLKAYDGLGLLKEVKPTFVWIDKKQDFEVTIIELFAEIMVQTNLHLGFQIFSNIHTAAGVPIVTDYINILSNKKIDIRTFQNGDEYMNCYEILESVCKSFGFLIYQNINTYQAPMNNIWYIVRPKYFKFDITHQFRRYDEQGVIGAQSGTVDKKSITYAAAIASERCAFINNTAEISIKPSSKYQNFVHTMKRETNLISFANEYGNFDDNEFVGSSLIRWIGAAESYWTHILGEKYIQLNKSFSSYSSLGNKSIFSLYTDLEDSFVRGFKFSFDYFIHRTAYADSIQINYQVVYSYLRAAGTHYRYLTKNDWGDVWGEEDTEYWRGVKVESRDNIEKWNTFSVQTERILDLGGNTNKKIYVVISRVQIHPASNDDYLRIKGVQLMAYDHDIPYSDSSIEQTFKQEINEHAFNTSPDIETNVGSMFFLHNLGMGFPIFLMPKMFFIGAILDATTEEPVLHNWKEWDGVSNIMTDAWLIKDILRFAVDRTTPKIILRGIIRGNLSFSTILVDKYGNRYFPNSIAYSAKLNQWKGEWIQILKETLIHDSSGSILGEFNDDFNLDFNI